MKKKSIFHFVKGSPMSVPFFQSFIVQCRFADPYQKHIQLSHERRGKSRQANEGSMFYSQKTAFVFTLVVDVVKALQKAEYSEFCIFAKFETQNML